MKKLLSFLIIISLFACTKSEVQPIPSPSPIPANTQRITNKDTINAHLINLFSDDADNGVNIYTNDAGYNIFKCWITGEVKPRFLIQGNGNIVFSNGTVNQCSIYNAGGELTFSSDARVSIQSTILNVGAKPDYTDNADAITHGLYEGDIYRTGDFLKVVHNP